MVGWKDAARAESSAGWWAAQRELLGVEHWAVRKADQSAQLWAAETAGERGARLVEMSVLSMAAWWAL